MFSRQIDTVSFTTLLVNTIVVLVGASSAYSQSAAVPSFEPGRVTVNLRILERTPTRVKFQFHVKNAGDHSVLIVSDPVSVEGSEGMYLSLSNDDPTLLEVSSQVFPPPNYTILAPKHRVTYRLLDPATVYEKEILLAAPLTETEPPWRAMLAPRAIDLSRIQCIELKVGVLPDEPEVRQAFATELSPTGLEIVRSGSLKGKSLVRIQYIASTKTKL